MDIQSLTELVKALDNMKTPVIISGLILFLGYCALHYWKQRCTNLNAKVHHADDAALRAHVVDFIGVLEKNLEIKRQWDLVLAEIQVTLLEVKNNFDGKINKANSLRIVQSRFEYIVVCLGYVIERSMYYNHYNGQEDFIASKVRTEMSDVLSDARSGLEALNLSVEPNLFFKLQPDTEVERFILCDLVWARVMPLFSTDKLDMTLKIERARLGIKNVCNDYVSQVVVTLSKIDLQCSSEVQRQALERNQRLHRLRQSARTERT